MGEEYKFIVPTRKLRERKDGKWHYVKRKLFTGYVLIKGVMDLDFYYKLKSVPGIIKLLANEGEALTVEERVVELGVELVDKI